MTLYLYRGHAICRLGHGQYTIYRSYDTAHAFPLWRATTLRAAKAWVREESVF